MLDINAGIPLADEPRILAEAVELVQSITDVPLSIDSSIVAALESGLAVYQGKALVNSVTGEEERLEAVLPLVKKHDAAVVAISNDETGISEDPDVRYAVAKRIVERAMDHGIPKSDVVIDPLVMPIGAINQAGRQVFHIVGRLRHELNVNTTCGASNISFGLPNRNGINGAFLSMAIGAGMTSAITSPLHAETMQACMGADVMMGHDPDCYALDPQISRAVGSGYARCPRTQRKPAPAAGLTGLAPRVRHRRTDRLHPLGSPGALSRRDPSPASRPGVGSGYRFRVRWTGVVRAVSGAPERGRVRQARGHFQRREPVAIFRDGVQISNRGR